MKGRDGFIQAYNAQAAVDAKAQIIMVHRLTNNDSDQDGLLPLLDAVAQNTSETPDEVSADAGFRPEANLEGLIADTIRSYAAAGRASKPASGRRGGPLVQAMRARLRQADVEPATGCENTSSSPSLDTSSKPEASASFSFAASTRSEASGP